jgi:predicted DNA-binding transcriptional regulator AlpA
MDGWENLALDNDIFPLLAAFVARRISMPIDGPQRWSINVMYQSNALAERQAFTIEEFCKAYGISRALYYKLLKSGQGPRIAKIGSKTLISGESAAEWLRAREVV